MDLAREWLEEGNCLHKLEPPTLAKLGNPNKLSDQAIEHIENIQNVHPAHGDLISIAVDDIKVLTGLMKIVVAFGIYPNLTDSSMVNLKERLAMWPLPPKNQGLAASTALERCIRKVALTIRKNDDIAKLILISPFMIDLLIGSALFPDVYSEFVSKLPTFSLYKLLLKAQSCVTPPVLTKKSLQMIIVDRKDAVRTLLELVIESDEHSESISSECIDRAVMVFKSVPHQVSTKQYIDCLGDQFYSLLATKQSESSSQVVQACVLSALRLDSIQPKLLGRLRNLLVAPFASAQATFPKGCTFSNSAGAFLNCLETGSKKVPSSFIQHVISSIIVSLWLLVCSLDSREIVDSSILFLIHKCIDYYPQAALKLVTNLLTTKLPGNLCWSIISGKEPYLIETISHNSQDDELNKFLKVLDTRMKVLARVVLQLNDATATQVLIHLMESYASDSFKGEDPVSSLSKLLVVKSIETLSTDDSIKKKLLDDPIEIIDFAFTFVTSRCSEAIYHSLDDYQSSPSVELLSLGDSDDEDEPEGHIAKNEDVNDMNALLEIALNLLGSALMEALSKDEPNFALSEERKSQLEKLSCLENVPKTIRARASFCYELITGSCRIGTEVNMDNDEEIFAAAQQALREPFVPSRAYGLHLISALVSRNSISLKNAFEFYANELGDEDSYIYLNAIKAIEDLTKFVKTEEVVELLIPHTKNIGSGDTDRVLRAREALIRVLTPGSIHAVSSALIFSLLEDLRAPARESQDVRIRLSSASIIGVIAAQFPLSISSELQSEIADCTLGVLRCEKNKEAAGQALHRAIVILALELINGCSDGFLNNISRQSLDSLVLEVHQVMQDTDDETLKDHCKAVLEAFKQAT